MNVDEEIRKKRRDEWLECWFAIEALAVSEDVVKESLARHVEKLSHAKDTFVHEKKFLETRRVENPMKDVPQAYSQVAEVRLFAKNLFTLLAVVLMYGPSSVEIISPEKRQTGIEEMQNIVNAVAGVVHEFAAAGVGGIVITPK